MSLELKIPDSVVEAMRLPRQDLEEQLLVELAVALYARSILPFGKARELANMNKYEFGILLGQRDVPRHYDIDDLNEDIAYANRLTP